MHPDIVSKVWKIKMKLPWCKTVAVCIVHHADNGGFCDLSYRDIQSYCDIPHKDYLIKTLKRLRSAGLVVQACEGESEIFIDPFWIEARSEPDDEFSDLTPAGPVA